MNVAFDPWIPVTTRDGSLALISVRDALARGADYVDFAVQPHERVAIMRLLLCISHAALDGPKDFNEWEDVPSRLPEAANKYLMEWKDSFELFHAEKPWLQVANISKDKSCGSASDESSTTAVSKLFFERSTGNNATLFDHEGTNNDRNTSFAEIPLGMLTFQCFSPGGLISEVYWGKYKTSKTSKDAPCVPSSMLHAFLRGENIEKSVWMNLLSDEDIDFMYKGYSKGRPVWEQVPRHIEDSASINNATQTYIGRLVPMARLIKLLPGGQFMLLGDGLFYPQFADGFPQECSATVVLRKNNNKEERALLGCHPGRAVWRDLAAVLLRHKTQRGARGPLAMDRLGYEDAIDLCVCALIRSKASILGTIESVFHIPKNMNTDLGINTYEENVRFAESIASKLGWAVETYRTEVDGGWEGRLKSAGPSKWQLKERLHSTATSHYWTAVEQYLSLLMDAVAALGTEAFIEMQKEWRSTLYAVAREAFELACPQGSPRQMRAFAKGLRRLSVRQGEPSEEQTDTPKREEEE